MSTRDDWSRRHSRGDCSVQSMISGVAMAGCTTILVVPKLSTSWATGRNSRSASDRSNASTTVDREVDTSDEISLVARQKDSGVPDILWISQALQRNTLGELLAILLSVLDADEAGEKLCRRQQRTDCRDTDLMRSKLRSQALCRLSRSSVSRSPLGRGCRLANSHSSPRPWTSCTKPVPDEVSHYPHC